MTFSQIFIILILIIPLIFVFLKKFREDPRYGLRKEQDCPLGVAISATPSN